MIVDLYIVNDVCKDGSVYGDGEEGIEGEVAFLHLNISLLFHHDW